MVVNDKTCYRVVQSSWAILSVPCHQWLPVDEVMHIVNSLSHSIEMIKKPFLSNTFNIDIIIIQMQLLTQMK